MGYVKIFVQTFQDCLGEIEILKDALTSLKTKQVQIEQQINSPDSTSSSRGCFCSGARNNVDEEMAATLRRGDQALVNWLRNQHYENETILKVRNAYHLPCY